MKNREDITGYVQSVPWFFRDMSLWSYSNTSYYFLVPFRSYSRGPHLRGTTLFALSNAWPYQVVCDKITSLTDMQIRVRRSCVQDAHKNKRERGPRVFAYAHYDAT